MGPLGWAMLLIQGLTAGITALIDHFKTKSDELERQAEQATERMKKRARDAAESIKKSYEAIQDYNKADRTQEINKGFSENNYCLSVALRVFLAITKRSLLA